MLKSLCLVAVLSFTAASGAQEAPSNEPYEFLLAKAAANEGRYDEALERFDRLIAKTPKDPVLLYERAMLLIDAGRIDRATQELRTVAAAHPDFYDAHRILGRLLLDRAGGDKAGVEEALKFLQIAFKLNPDDLSTGIAVSQLLMSSGRLNDAERVLATMVERAPDQRALNYNYANILTKLGRGNEAKPYLERAVAADPTFGPAIMALLDMYQEENEWLKAAAVLQPLIADDPLNVEMQRQQAFYFLRGGDARSAYERYSVLAKADPKDTRSQFGLAEALNDLEQYGESAPIYAMLLKATPDEPELLGSYGIALIGQKKWDEATAVFNRLLALGNAPDHLAALARTQLAHIDMRKENYGAAVETAKSIFIFRDRPNSQAINIALEAMRKQDKTAEGLALIEPLVAQFPNDPFVNAKYVEWLVRAGKADAAKQHAAAQAKVGARNAITVSEAYVQADQNAAAVEYLKSAAAARPEEIDLQFQLASLYERTGDRKAAEKVFLGILEKNADHAPTLNYLGYMWAEGSVNLE
ncbi:MAG TPA: tetratricopeptide repeat protein, partial [Thermoanaerobaculia bacterium]|nr:tetratricopeptide repeat protein [Thermoanaerobaculia bacterium]